MGIGYYWANMDRKEYIDTNLLGDNDKLPIGPTAMVLHYLMLHRWGGGERITYYYDSGDLPWSDYVEGHEGWKDVTELYDHHHDYEWTWNPNGYDDPVVLLILSKEKRGGLDEHWVPQEVAQALDCIDREEDEVGMHRATVDAWRKSR